MTKERLYPTQEELMEQAEYLSNCPESIYKQFARQGIPPEVQRYVKRTSFTPKPEMKTIATGIIMFVAGIGLAFMASLVWWQAHPKVIEVPAPYAVVEYQTITEKEYVDRWHEPEIVTANVTEIREVEVEKIVLRQHSGWKFFETLPEFTTWLEGKLVLLMPPADCDDYAQRLQVEAYKDGYILSAQLVDKDGYLFGKKVIDGEGEHDMIRVNIGNDIYVVEPQIDTFRIIKVGERD